MKWKNFTGSFLTFIISFIAVSSYAQTWYRSVGGNWSNLGTWEFSTNGGGSWGAAPAYPTMSNSDSIIIQFNTDVDVDVNVTLDQLFILGGTLQVTNGNTVTYGAAGETDYLSGLGQLNVLSGGAFNVHGTQVTITGMNTNVAAGGVMNFENGTTVILAAQGSQTLSVIVSGTFNINGVFGSRGKHQVTITSTGLFKLARFIVPPPVPPAWNFITNSAAEATEISITNLGLVEMGTPGVTLGGAAIGAGTYSNLLINTGTVHILGNTTTASVLSFLNEDSLRIDNGAVLYTPGEFRNNTNGRVFGGGTLRISQSFANTGHFSPGLSPDTLAVEPDNPLFFGGGTLHIELSDDDLNPGTGWDLLQVNGVSDVRQVELQVTQIPPDHDFRKGRYVFLTSGTAPIQTPFQNVSLPPTGFIVDYSEADGIVDSNGQATTPNIALIKTTFPLPVRWVSFSGNYANDKVGLTWITGSESNTDRYVIERSVDGRNFTEIGSVMAAGNTPSNTTYRFTDAAPVRQAGNQYRLKQVDKDGRFVYSNVIRITIGKTKAFAATVTPNPVTSVMTLSIEEVADKESLLFEVLNTAGAVVYRRQIAASGNAMVIPLPRPVVTSGLYFYRLTRSSSKEAFSGKLVLE